MENTTHPPTQTKPLFDIPPRSPADIEGREDPRTAEPDTLQFPEIGIEVAFRRAESGLRVAGERLKSQIRDYPAESVLLAAAGGYLCNRLPLQSLLVTGFKILTAFAPPTLLALGICKVAEHSRRWSAQNSSRRPMLVASEGGPSIIVVTDDA